MGLWSRIHGGGGITFENAFNFSFENAFNYSLERHFCREATFLKVCRTACFHYMVEDVCLSVCLFVCLSFRTNEILRIKNLKMKNMERVRFEPSTY